MYHEGVREIHTLMLAFLGFCHERLFVRMRKNHACCQQMSKNQFKIINILYRHQALTATEISRMLDIEKGSLTTMVDQLEAMDMIIRRVDSNDRRRVLLSLSDIGVEHMDKTMEAYSAVLDDLFQEVDPEDMEKFVDSLRYIVAFTARL